MEAAVDRLEVKVIQAEGLRGTESGPPSAYAEVRKNTYLEPLRIEYAFSMVYNWIRSVLTSV